MVMPGSTVIWQVSDSTVISTVLPACGRPTWIRWPPVMMAPRTETRRETGGGSGSRGGCSVAARPPRSLARACAGTGPPEEPFDTEDDEEPLVTGTRNLLARHWES